MKTDTIPQYPDSFIQPLFTMNNIMTGVVDSFLAAATIIADTKLDDYQALEKLDLVEGYEFEHQVPLLTSILAKALKPFHFDVVYQDSQLTIDWYGEVHHGAEHPLFIDTDCKPMSLRAFFFGDAAGTDLYECPNDGSKPYRLRANLLRQLSLGATAVLLNFPGDNLILDDEITSKIALMEDKYDAYAVSQYWKSIEAELATVQENFEKACKSPRVQLAQQLSGSDLYIDLLSIQAEETVKALKKQLEDMLCYHLSCRVSVTLENNFYDTPKGYILTHTPDEAPLEALSMLMLKKSLPHELINLIAKSSLGTAIYKHLQQPTQSIVVYEGIGLSEITLATHIVIHIDTAKDI